MRSRVASAAAEAAAAADLAAADPEASDPAAAASFAAAAALAASAAAWPDTPALPTARAFASFADRSKAATLRALFAASFNKLLPKIGVGLFSAAAAAAAWRSSTVAESNFTGDLHATKARAKTTGIKENFITHS